MPRPGPISAKPLSILLSDVFTDAYAKQGFAARELVTRWTEIAGERIAAYCEPLKIQWPRPVEGQPQEPATLVLRVEGPMALEIQHSSDVILERVNRFFGYKAVARIKLRQGAVKPPEDRKKAKAPPSLKPIPMELGDSLRDIGDPALRTVLESLARSFGSQDENGTD